MEKCGIRILSRKVAQTAQRNNKGGTAQAILAVATSKTGAFPQSFCPLHPAKAKPENRTPYGNCRAEIAQKSRKMKKG
jgi:hypothetical protein